MQETWIQFDLLEIFFGAVCMAVHIEGFQKNEALPHNLLFCGTFFGFPFRALFSIISICAGLPTGPILEFVVNVIAAAFYYFTCMYSMHLAEEDIHLIYLTEIEEVLHPYFFYCKFQSIFSLAAACVHLLHAILALDAASITKSKFALGETDYFNPALEPIELYVLGRATHSKLNKLKCFYRLTKLEFEFTKRKQELSRFSKGLKNQSFSASVASRPRSGTKSMLHMRFAPSRSRGFGGISTLDPNIRRRLQAQLEEGEFGIEMQTLGSSGQPTATAAGGSRVVIVDDIEIGTGVSQRSQEGEADESPRPPDEK